MADNIIEAILRIHPRMSDKDKKAISKDIENTFLGPRSKALKTYEDRIAKLNTELSKIESAPGSKAGGRRTRAEQRRLRDQERNLRAQIKLNEELYKARQGLSDISQKQINQGQKSFRQIQSGQKAYKDLNKELRKATDNYRRFRDAESKALGRAISASEREGFTPTALRQIKERKDAEVKSIRELTDVRKQADKAAQQRAKDAKKRVEAQKEQSRIVDNLAKEERTRADRIAKERMQAAQGRQKEREARVKSSEDLMKRQRDQAKKIEQQTKKSLQDARKASKETKRITQARANRANAAYGLNAMAQAGGTSSIGDVAHQDLPYVKAGIERKMQALSRLQNKLIRNGRESGKMFADNKRQLNQYADALTHVRQRMNGFASAIRETSLFVRQFIRLGIGFSAVFSVINGVRALGGALVDLDKQLKSIKAISSATDAQMRTLSTSIQMVAQQTPFNTTEIAEATQVLAQAGVEIKDIPKALKSTAEFATGTASSIETAADLITTMKNVFGELNYGDAANELTRVVNVSKTQADDLKSIVSTSASTAKQFDISSGHYLAAVAALRNAGLKASTVGTGLRRLMMDLFTPKSTTIKVLQKRYQEIGEKLTESQIKGRFFAFSKQDSPISAALRELQRLGFTSGPGRQELQGAYDIRTRNALSALIHNIHELEQLAPQIQIGNAAMEASQTQMKSLANSARNLGAAISVMANSIAGDSVPVLAQMATDLTGIVQRVTDLNRQMKSETGTGLGSALSAGTISGFLGYKMARGSFMSRAAGGLRGFGAGAIASTFLTSPGLSSQTNTMVSLLAGPIIAGVLEGLTSRLSGRGRKRTGIGSPYARGAKVAAEAGLVSSFISSIVGFFTKVGSAIRTGAAGITGLGFLARGLSWLNPVLGAVTTLGSLVFFLWKFSQKADGNDVMKRLQAMDTRFQEKIDAYNSQMEALAQFDTKDPNDNSAAAALKTLKERVTSLNNFTDKFLGGKAKDVSRAQAILKRLTQGPGAAEGNPIRKDLIKRLAGPDGLEIVNKNGEIVKKTQSFLLANQDNVQTWADHVEAVSTQAEGLQKALKEMVLNLRDHPDDLNEAQKAFMNQIRNADQQFYDMIMGFQDIDPGVFAENLQKMFANIYQEALSKISSADLDTYIQNTISKMQDGTLTKAQLTERTNKAIEIGRQLGKSALEVLDEIRKAMDNAKTQLDQVKGQVMSAVNTPYLSMGGGKAYAGVQVTPGRTEEQTKTAKDNLDRMDEVVQGRTDREKDAQEEHNRRMRIEAKADFKSILDEVQSAGFKKFIQENSADLSPKAMMAAQGVAEGNLDWHSLIATDADNTKIKSKISKYLEQILGTYHQISGSAKEIQKVYQQDASLKQEELLADQRLQTLKAEQAPLQEQLKALGVKQNAQMAQLTDELGFQVTKAGEIGSDADKQARVSNKITSIKTRMMQLSQKQLKEQEAVISGYFGAKKGSVRSGMQYASDMGNLEDYKKARQKLHDLTAQQIDAMDAVYKKLGYDKKTRQRLATEHWNKASQEDVSVSQDMAAFGNAKGAGPWLKKFGTSGFSTGDPFTDAFHQQQGWNPTDEQQMALEKNRLYMLQQQAKYLDEMRNSQSLTVQQQKAYDDELDRTRELIGQVSGDLKDLGATATEQLAKGFDPQQLIASLQQSDSSVKNLGTSIRQNLTQGIDSFADSLTQAQIGAQSFTKSVGQAFQNLAKSVLKSLNRMLANQVAQQLLGFAMSAFGGWGYSAKSQATAQSWGSTAASHYSDGLSFARGGIVNGPGTATSDSILARVSNGEGILNAKAVNLIGPKAIHALNNGVLPQFRSGGMVSSNNQYDKTKDKGGNTYVNIENHTDSKSDVKRHRDSQGNEIIDIMLTKVAEDIHTHGKVGQAIQQTTNAGQRLMG